MNILLVDDEPSYLEQIGEALRHRGHTLATAVSGREAIDAGLTQQPELLIADWLLKDQIHGLHVAGVLQCVYERLPVIVITGFGSPELKTKVLEDGFILLEKPFELDDLARAVETIPPKRPGSRRLLLPILKVNQRSEITYRNLPASELIEATFPGVHVSSLSDILRAGAEEMLRSAESDWASVDPRATHTGPWKARVRRLGNESIVMLLPSDRFAYFQHHPIVKMLVESHEAQRSQWPFGGRILVVDDEEIIRSFTATMFEHIGCICHTAETHRQALSLFERDPGIKFVILDYEMPGEDPAQLVARLREVRPEVVIVGSSGADRRGAFAEAGVWHFLSKPWRMEDLVDLLQSNALDFRSVANL